MKKPVFLILIGIGVLLLVGGVVFVVPWFGKMLDEMEQIAELHRQHRRALKMSAREPLTDEQEKLLSQLLEIVAETDASQNPNDLEAVLSSDPYLDISKSARRSGLRRLSGVRRCNADRKHENYCPFQNQKHTRNG